MEMMKNTNYEILHYVIFYGPLLLHLSNDYTRLSVTKHCSQIISTPSFQRMIFNPIKKPSSNINPAKHRGSHVYRQV